jgi:hypothetical protein
MPGRTQFAWKQTGMAAVLVAFAITALAPAAAQAGAGASATVGFVPGTLKVGQTGTGTLRLTNGNTSDIGPGGNTDGLQTNTVCNFGDVSPPCEAAIGAPLADRGIQMVPACKSPSGGLCPAGQEDPGVIAIAGPGTGSEACTGLFFTVTPLNDTFGTFRFTPTVGRVQLPGPEVAPPSNPRCTITYSFTVLKMPANGTPVAGGIATGQATLHTQYIGITDPSVNPAAKNAFGRGTNNLGLTVQKATPTITTMASPGVGLGSALAGDTATINGLVAPITTGVGAGNVIFRLYGPDDLGCANQVFQSPAQPITYSAGNTVGASASGAFTPLNAGTYRWRAFYSGDANNDAVAGVCGDLNESADIGKKVPTIATVASADVPVGGQLTDQATVSGLLNAQPNSTVTFNLYPPSAGATCTGSPIFTSTVTTAVSGGGTIATATSAPFTTTAAGIYRWRATFNNDANNTAVTGDCDLATETRNVTTPPPPPPGVVPPPPPPPCTETPTPVPPGGTRCVHPAEVCTTPPGPAPAGGELCARGTAAIKGTTGCAGTPFRVTVRGRQIDTVTFTMDGKVIKKLVRPNRGVLFVLPVNPRTQKIGVHRVLARTTFNKKSGTKARVLRVTYSRCARQAVSPEFTG